MINRLFDHYFTDTNQQEKAGPTTDTELEGNYGTSSVTKTPSQKRRRLLQQSNGSRDIMACKDEGCNENYASSYYPWVPDLDVPSNGIRKNPSAAVESFTNVGPQSPKCPSNYGPQSYAWTNDTNKLSGLTFAPCSSSVSSIACDDINVQSGLSDGAMNGGMGAEDWMYISDYYFPGDAAEY